MTAVLKDDTELFRQFSDNEGFRRWLKRMTMALAASSTTELIRVHNTSSVTASSRVLMPRSPLARPASVTAISMFNAMDIAFWAR